MSSTAGSNDTPRSDCYMGTWLAYKLSCPNRSCLHNPESRCAPTLADRVPHVDVIWSSQTPQGRRSLLELELPMARIGMCLDDRHGTSDAAKPESGHRFTAQQCRVIACQLPRWPGTHCPLCATALLDVSGSREKARAAQQSLLHRPPYMCVTSVNQQWTLGFMLVRIDSPVLLDFHLTLELPTNVLPNPVK